MAQENDQFPYIGKECYVYTTRTIDDTEHVKFTSQSPEKLIAGLKKEEVKEETMFLIKLEYWGSFFT